MNCPECDADSRVTETRAVAGNMLRRRRRCLSLACDHRFSSIEAIVDSGVRHDDAAVVVLPKRTARELRAALSLIGQHLDLHEPSGKVDEGS